jgi:hypothetical protein
MAPSNARAGLARLQLGVFPFPLRSLPASDKAEARAPKNAGARA